VDLEVSAPFLRWVAYAGALGPHGETVADGRVPGSSGPRRSCSTD